MKTDPNAARPSSNGGGNSSAARHPLNVQFEPGDMVAERYQIISVLGRGGFGCVYKVLQVLLKKEFALKTLNPINTSEITILRLHKEAQAASRLDHPNLVRAVDFGMLEDSQPYLVMDLVEGPTLSQYLKQNGKAPLRTALQLFLPLCNALAYAHQQGVVHRDLKPSNVILAADDSGQHQYVPKIVDFGIAKLQSSELSRAMTLTTTGEIFGTPLYMSPEQCMGAGVDGRSDIYALGCMLFETLTGAPPFSGSNPLEIMMQHGTGVVPSLKEASLGETFPPALERVIHRMLAKDPKDRYQDCSAVAVDLAAIDRGDFGLISDSPTAILLRQQRRQQVSSSLLFAVMGIIGGASIGYAAHQYLTPSQPVQSVAKVVDEGKGFLGLDTRFTYYSKIEDGKKIFEFPGFLRHKLGDILWWQSGKLHSVPAIKIQQVPKDAKLIFRVEGDILVSPDLWARFHRLEFQGILVDLHSCYVEEEALNQSIHEITQQPNLQILTLYKKVMSRKTFLGIGGLSQLRWFDATVISVDDSEIKGEVLAKLPNLQNLRVLRLELVEDITPALIELSKRNSLRRLSLPHNKLTESDLKLITKLQSVEVLSLTRNDLQKLKIDVLAELGKMPNLKKVIVDAEVLSSAKPQTLSKLTGLLILTDNAQLPEPIRQAIAGNAGLKVIQDSALKKRDGDWFDPSIEDPEPIIGSK
jgi:serine/threonine protein kinase